MLIVKCKVYIAICIPSLRVEMTENECCEYVYGISQVGRVRPEWDQKLEIDIGDMTNIPSLQRPSAPAGTDAIVLYLEGATTFSSMRCRASGGT